MKKYIFFLMGVVCFLLSSLAVHANELNKSDANIIGDRKSVVRERV